MQHVSRRSTHWLLLMALFTGVIGCSVPPGPTASIRLSGEAPDIPGLIDVPNPLPAGEPGTVIARETLPANPDLPGTRAERILYLSTSPAGDPIAVSGYAVIPAGTPPQGGWPVLSWGHGTVGLSDACALSRNPMERLYGIGGYDNAASLIRAGVMVVATDYPGLGTDGPHPYLDGASSGRSMLDAARAAKHLGGSNDVILEGFSQGGHATLFAGSLASTYSPELNITGVLAIAPGSLAGLASAVLPLLGLTSSYSPLLIYGRLAADPTLNAGDVLNPSGIEKMNQLDDNVCYDRYLEPSDYRADPIQLPDWTASFAANEPGAYRIEAPLLLVQGTDDTSVPSIATDLLCLSYSLNQTHATLWNYAGHGHVDTVYTSRSDREAWILHQLGLTTDPPTPSASSRGC